MLALALLIAGLAGHDRQASPDDVAIYQVKAHETLSDIGRRGLEPASAFVEVQRFNHIADARFVRVGVRLRIPIRLLRTTPIQATVESFRGAATANGGGAEAALKAGETLNEGALLQTGENAFVRLSLPDGSHLTIPSNSRVRLERLRAAVLTGSIDRQIGVLAGRLETQVTPMTNPASRFVVTTPVARSSVRGTEFRVAYEPGQKSAASGVLKGRVDVANPKMSILAQVGQGVVASPQGLKGPLPLLKAPALDRAALVQSGEDMHFSIVPVVGAKSYRLTIAADANLEAPLVSRTADRATIDLPGLPDGAYYLRLTAISPDGLEGLPGLSSFVRAKGELAILGAAPTPSGVEFRWAGPATTGTTYHFTLTSESDRHRRLIDKEGLTEPEFTAPALKAGDYVWGVSAVRTVGGRRVELISDPQALHVP
jgi:hypothetical protein